MVQFLIKTSLQGVHIEKEEEEEEVDNSLRGRLVRLLEKVKKFREKKVEVELEPQEDKKPSEVPVKKKKKHTKTQKKCVLLKASVNFN